MGTQRILDGEAELLSVCILPGYKASSTINHSYHTIMRVGEYETHSDVDFEGFLHLLMEVRSS